LRKSAEEGDVVALHADLEMGKPPSLVESQIPLELLQRVIAVGVGVEAGAEDEVPLR
jgi:hypothetical protein